MASIVVVDNASADGSADGLGDAGGRLRTIRNATNRGFAAACNAGAALGASPLVLFLNPDTRLEAGALTVPLRFMAAAAARRVGICGIRLVDAEGRAQRCCARLPGARHFVHQALGLPRLAPAAFPGVELAEFDHESDRDVDHVMGAFYLVRRTLLEALNGFDERFFMYLEDLDFSKRASERGWRTRFLAGAHAFHLQGGTSRHVKAARLFYALRSRILFSLKHHRPGGAAAVLLATALAEPPLRLLRGLARAAPEELRSTLLAYALLYRNLPSMLKAGADCRR